MFQVLWFCFVYICPCRRKHFPLICNPYLGLFVVSSAERPCTYYYTLLPKLSKNFDYLLVATTNRQEAAKTRLIDGTFAQMQLRFLQELSLGKRVRREETMPARPENLETLDQV